MALLSERDRQAVQAQLAPIDRPVTLLLFTQTIGAPEAVFAAGQVLREVAELHDLVKVEEANFILEKDRASDFGIAGIPGIVLLRDGQDTRMRFLGAPVGHEFASFIQAIVLAGCGDSGLSPESRALIADRVTDAVRIRVFGTPTCHHCPKAVALAHRMAVESALITSTSVDAIQFPELSRRFKVTGVPKTVASSSAAVDVELLGAMIEQEFVASILGLPPTDLARA